MEVPQDVIDKWQAIWQQVCDMAYHSKNVVGHVYAPIKVLGDIEQYKNASNFELITLDHTWKKVSNTRDENRDFVEPGVVPELQEIYVPRVLFEAMGVYTWFQHSFPNCLILFWEDIM